MSERRSAGFTLVEILIALAVVALVLSAAGGAAGLAVRNQQGLREQMLAHWVAMDVITEFRLAEDWAEIDEHSGRSNMSDRVWEWRAVVIATEVDSLRRIEVTAWPEVGGDEDEATVRVVGFIGRDRSRTPTGLWTAVAAEEEAPGP